MKKPRTFWLVESGIHFGHYDTFSSLNLAKRYVGNYYDAEAQIIKVQEITNAKTTKDKKPKRPKAARKVQAVAGKRKKEVEKARKEKD